tara:strand:+ start:558 stop:1121 length:564 start_codon:yes stop_codon:yes gene_type:complete
MQKMVLVLGLLTIVLVMILSCAYQEPIVIEEPRTPRVVFREIPAESEGQKEVKEEKEELFSYDQQYPDMTRGYIENKAFPYVPKVWLIKEGLKIVLVGPEVGPPKFATGEIREFNLPPGFHIFHIERWQHFSYYGGWQKAKKVEVVKVNVARFPEKGSWRGWADGHYGWFVTIHPEYSTVYSGYVKP